MNFLELCQRVIDEGDVSSIEINDVHIGPDDGEQVANVVRWVKQAYLDIQRMSRFWKFHQQTQAVLFETLADGTMDYTAANVRRILRNSLTIRVKANPIDDQELIYLTWEEWKQTFLTVDFNPSRPVWFTEMPQDGVYRLTPGPEQVYEVIGDFYVRQFRLEAAKDEPAWHEDHHDIIVWQALTYYLDEYESPERLENRVARALRLAKMDFYNEYLPNMHVSGDFE